MLVDSDFCPACNKSYESYASFCSDCGSSLVGIHPDQIGNIMSIRRVVLLSILSVGWYLLYWFYRTWKQYSIHTGRSAYPFWHAVSILVPLLNLITIYVHFRDLGVLVSRRNVPVRVSPTAAVIAGVVIIGFSFFSSVFVPDSAGLLTVIAVSLFPLLIELWLLLSMQSSLNIYWSSFPRASAARIGEGEILVAVLGIIWWIVWLVF